MLVFDLICMNGHVFEAYFPKFEAYSQQKANGLVSCAVCGTNEVSILPKGRVVKKEHKVSDNLIPKTTKPTIDAMMLIRSMNHFIKTNCENVGERFPNEARKMFYGEEPPKNIYGSASEDEREGLAEEGIPFATIPKLPEEVNN